jgi:hypothetical protein
MRHEHDRFEKEIAELHAIRRKEWQQQTAELADLIDGSGFPPSGA